MIRAGRTSLRAAGAALGAIVLLAAAGQGQTASSAPAGSADAKHVAWDGNRALPVHLLPLRDENDEPIIPTETDPLPYSARFTCGPCHDYGTIKGGWHFGAMTAKTSGRPGEPWLQVDPKTGTILPLSYRRWPGLYDPRAVGLTAWDFTMLFGRNLPGGGPAEPSDEAALADPKARWNVSGKAEVNCLACHNRSGRQDHSEWAKQVLRENLRWAATAAAGLGEVGGMASRLDETWDVTEGPNLDDHEWAVAPSVAYKTTDFDSKHRTFFDLSYQPADDRCVVCHSVSPKDAAHWSADRDVHTAAGLKCTDCHRGDIRHLMLRGYETEAAETGNPAAAAFTCRGCHLGEDAAGRRTVTPGRLGAPYPKHAGIPLVHFKRLACTVCHSGPKPREGYTRVRTSRANRLGVYGVATWSTDAPEIIEPVYAKDGHDKIAPQRLVWPAFWGRRADKAILPLRPAEIEAAAGDTLKPEDHIAQVLIALSQVTADDETPVLASGRFVFAPNVDGGINATEPAGTKAGTPAFWAIRKDGRTSPLVPDFDPAAEDKDPAIETRFQEYLQALGTVADKPGKPVIVVRKTIYRFADGFLNATEAPAGLAGAAGAGWLVQDQWTPLVPDFDIRTVTAKAGTGESLTEEQVSLVLGALAKTAAKGQPLYISGGRLFELDKGGRLVSRESGAAAPVTWPLAHDVRPAQQSLGWNGCADCHSGASDFFFDTIKGAGPLLTKSVAKRSAASFMGLGGLFQRVFGLSFIVRPVFKIVLAICAIIAGSLLFLAGLVALGRVAGFMEKR
jgi:hypothetical protein